MGLLLLLLMEWWTHPLELPSLTLPPTLVTLATYWWELPLEHAKLMQRGQELRQDAIVRLNVCPPIFSCIYVSCAPVYLYHVFMVYKYLHAVVPLSSSTMTIISNNTLLSLSTIGEGVSALSCHTELTTCCRDRDNPTGEALGDWVGPDGDSLSETSEEGFYVTREMSSVSLNLVEGSSVTAGSYCCQVPRSGGGMSTHCIMVTGED